MLFPRLSPVPGACNKETLYAHPAILEARRVTDPCQLGKSQCTDQMYEELQSATL